MTTARDRMHIEFCRDTRCQVETEQPGDACQNMDHLLNLVEEEQAHKIAQMLVTHPGLQKRALGAGLVYGAELIEPYYKVHAFDPELAEDHIHPGEEHPECKRCVDGVEHWHRIADDQAVGDA